jgi:hypothetical protein
MPDVNNDLISFVGRRKFSTIVADPPWQFINRTGKIAPEHGRLARYPTLKVDEIAGLRWKGSPLPRRIFICGAPMRCCPTGSR